MYKDNKSESYPNNVASPSFVGLYFKGEIHKYTIILQLLLLFLGGDDPFNLFGAQRSKISDKRKESAL